VLRSVLPRFELVVDRPAEDVADRLVRHLAGGECSCVGWVAAPYAELHVPEQARHFWSPRLQVTFEQHADGTHVCCTFRPEPEVWTGFVFGHCLCLTSALVGLSLALAQWSLAKPPTAVFAGALALLISAGLYVGALFGHRLGREQMDQLRRSFDRALQA
jgi:hypothetical protein